MLTFLKLDHSILELLVDNMTRFNEAEEADRQGIYHVLGIFENFVGSKPPLAERLVLKTKLLPWLLNRVQSKRHDENRGYAAELLSILLQGSQPNRLELGKKDGVETLLSVASVCRNPEVAQESHSSIAISSTRPCRCRRGRVFGERIRLSVFRPCQSRGEGPLFEERRCRPHGLDDEVCLAFILL